MRLFLLLSFLFYSSYTFSQANLFDKARIGIEAGLLSNSMSYKDNLSDLFSTPPSFKSKINYIITVSAEIPWKKNLYFNPGISYSKKGVSFNYPVFSTGIYPVRRDISIFYYSVEFLLRYKKNLGNGSYFVEAGPYFSYANNGNQTVELNQQGTVSNKIVFKGSIYNNDSYNYEKFYLRRTDGGLKINLGYELKSRLYFKAISELGILNTHPRFIDPDPESGIVTEITLKNKSWGILIGYRF